MINTLLLDPKSKDLDILRQRILTNCPNINIVGREATLEGGKSFLGKKDINLIFINPAISLSPNCELLSKLSNLGIEIIFISDSFNFISNICKYQFSGYLIKPIKNKDLIEAVGIAKVKLSKKQNHTIFSQENKRLKYAPGNLVGIPTIEGYEFLKINNIIRCEGYLNCTKIIYTNKNTIISSYNIGVFKKTLQDHQFYSPHKSHLVNLIHIKKYLKEGIIQMSDQSNIPISKRRKAAFLKLMLLSR